MARTPARWLTFVGLALLGALVCIPAQAAEPEPTDAAQKERADLQQQIDRASMLIHLGQPAEALVSLTELERRTEAIGDPDLHSTVLGLQAVAHGALRDPVAAVEKLQAAYPLRCGSPTPYIRAQCADLQLLTGEFMSWTGHPEAVAVLEDALRRARAEERPELEIMALNALGEALLALDALSEAQKRHQEAFDLTERHSIRSGRWNALMGLGRVAVVTGDLATAQARFEEALRHTALRTDHEADASGHHALGRVWALQGRLTEAEASYALALTLIKPQNELRLSDVLISKGELALDQNKLDEAQQHFQQALELKSKHADARGKMWALIGLGIALSPKKAGRVEAQQRLEEAHSLALAIGSRSGEAEALRGLGTVWLKQYRAAQAADTFKRALEIYVALGIPHGQVRALLDLASAQFELVEPQDMVQSCEQALMIATRHGLQPLVNRAGIQLTEALRLRSAELRFQKDWAQAEAVWRQSMEIAAQTGDPTLVSTGYKGLAELLARQGRLAEAEAAYMKTIELLTITDEQFLLPFVWLTLSDLAAVQGRLPEAEAHLRRAVEGLDKPGMERSRVFALFTLAELQSDLGWVEEAKKTYETSVAVAAVLALIYLHVEVDARVRSANFLVGQGDRRAARAVLRPCRDRAQASDWETNRLELEITCLAALGEAQRSPWAAKRSAAQLVAVAEAAPELLGPVSMHMQVARAHLRLDQADEAEAALLLAIREADRRGDPAQRAEALMLLAELLDARGETAEAEAARAAAAAP